MNNFLYTAVGYSYNFLLKIVASFNTKARLMIRGRKKTWKVLEARRDKDDRYVWFHVSSLGEFEQGRPLMEQIKAECPNIKIALSFFSPSGYEVRKNYDGADLIVYLPADKPRRVRRFLDLVNPEKAIFVKYDFWPCYLTELKRREIPTYLISAIFRPTQLFFRWYGKPYLDVLKCFTHLYVQDEQSKTLLTQYGITKVSVAGDTRFDRVITVSQAHKDLTMVGRFISTAKGYVIVAGSTWVEDETILLHYFANHANAKLIIAPHEINESRLMSIESKIKRPFVRLSEAKDKTISKRECLIIDSFGLLSSIYHYAHISFIGGGFGSGIHNTLEAAVYGTPVIFGPKYEKFREAKELIACGGGFSIRTQEEFDNIMQRFMREPDFYKTSCQQSYDYVHDNAGTTALLFKEIEFCQ